MGSCCSYDKPIVKDDMEVRYLTPRNSASQLTVDLHAENLIDVQRDSENILNVEYFIRLLKFMDKAGGTAIKKHRKKFRQQCQQTYDDGNMEQYDALIMQQIQTKEPQLEPNDIYGELNISDFEFSQAIAKHSQNAEVADLI